MDFAALSLANYGKPRCGDAWGFREFDDGNLAVGCVSDGVSGAAKDWLASRLTVDTFFESFAATASLPIEDRLTTAVTASDKRVRQAHETGGKRMLATVVAVVWDYTNATLFWMSCGDSRIYCLKSSKLHQVSVDHSKAVIARGRDGKMLVSSGVLLMRNGLTTAIGALDEVPPVEQCGTAGIRAVLMATDGYYGCASFTEQTVAGMCQALSLDKMFKKHESVVRDEQRDDATILVMRESSVLSEDVERMRNVMESDDDFRTLGIELFAANTIIRDELIAATRKNDIDRVVNLLAYSGKHTIDIGKGALVALADEAAKIPQGGKRVLDTIITAIRRYGNP